MPSSQPPTSRTEQETEGREDANTPATQQMPIHLCRAVTRHPKCDLTVQSCPFGVGVSFWTTAVSTDDVLINTCRVIMRRLWKSEVSGSGRKVRGADDVARDYGG